MSMYVTQLSFSTLSNRPQVSQANNRSNAEEFFPPISFRAQICSSPMADITVRIMSFPSSYPLLICRVAFKATKRVGKEATEVKAVAPSTKFELMH